MRAPREADGNIRPLRVIDLCSGLGGATAAFRDRGHEVFTVDVDPRFKPDLVKDVRALRLDDLPWGPGEVDFIWASPPCQAFSREAMPWLRASREDIEEAMSIVRACYRVILALHPPYWVIENVRGALRHLRPLLGDPVKRIGPFYLWGEVPIFHVKVPRRYKQRFSGKTPEKRARVPYEVSLALCKALEWSLGGEAEGGPLP